MPPPATITTIITKPDQTGLTDIKIENKKKETLPQLRTLTIITTIKKHQQVK